MAAERLHGDDTTVPLLAPGKAATARLWVYVRDDRPFAGGAPRPRYSASRDRRGEHPQAHLVQWNGILQADAYGGFGELYNPNRQPEPITEALCWAHARRKFFELAGHRGDRPPRKGRPPISPLALEAVRRIDAVFDLERAINGADAEHRLAVRKAEAAPLVAELERWMRAGRERLSRHAPVAKAMNYMLSRWPSFARFLEDGRICLTNNAAERALRGAATTRSLCTLSQVSVNIASWFSGTARHGPAVRPIAAITRSCCRSEARIWYGAPGTTCSAGRTASLMSRRMRWRETPSVVAASDIVSHSPFFSADW